MYKIYPHKSPKAKVQIRLDLIPLTKVPRTVFLGTGDKKKRYRAHIDTCFTGNTQLLRLLAEIHHRGKKEGDVCLVSDIKAFPYQAAVIKEFIEANGDFLNAVIPYLIPSEAHSQVSEEQTALIPEELKEKLEGEKMTPMGGSRMTLGDLPEDDRNQIAALIAEDQARSAAVAQAQPRVIPITVGDGSEEIKVNS
jgi:hypothetical protein